MCQYEVNNLLRNIFTNVYNGKYNESINFMPNITLAINYLYCDDHFQCVQGLSTFLNEFDNEA